MVRPTGCSASWGPPSVCEGETHDSRETDTAESGAQFDNSVSFSYISYQREIDGLWAGNRNSRNWTRSSKFHQPESHLPSLLPCKLSSLKLLQIQHRETVWEQLEHFWVTMECLSLGMLSHSINFFSWISPTQGLDSPSSCSLPSWRSCCPIPWCASHQTLTAFCRRPFSSRSFGWTR